MGFPSVVVIRADSLYMYPLLSGKRWTASLHAHKSDSRVAHGDIGVLLISGNPDIPARVGVLSKSDNVRHGYLMYHECPVCMVLFWIIFELLLFKPNPVQSNWATFQLLTWTDSKRVRNVRDWTVSQNTCAFPADITGFTSILFAPLLFLSFHYCHFHHIH